MSSKIFIFCSVKELQESGRVTKFVDELRDEISAFYVDGKYHVISSICPHFGGEFDFDAQHCILTCRWHGWKFNLKTKRSLTDYKEYQTDSLVGTLLKGKKEQPLGCFPYKGQLATYEYQIADGMLEVIYP